VLGDIVDAGITVIDMEDGAREYSKLDSDPFAFVMVVVLRFARAREPDYFPAVVDAETFQAAQARGGQTQSLGAAGDVTVPAHL
jgi:hypothetical protein